MSYKETLIHDICKLIRRADYCTIEITPLDGDGYETSQNPNGNLEIGLSKKAYLKIFQQSHDYWHSLASGDSLLNTYYCTLGYLLTTNENHHVIKTHEIICHKLLASGHHPKVFYNDFKIIMAFLSSKLKRINKSSSLWIWFKKLLIIMVFNQLFNDINPLHLHLLDSSIDHDFHLIIDTVIRSCQHHYSNYYASSFLRWCIRIVKNVGNSNIRNHCLQYIENQLVLACHLQLSDVSLWSTLHILIRDHRKDIIYAVEDYNMIIKQLRIPELISIEANFLPIRDSSQLSIEQMKWLLGVECRVFTPYWCVVSSENLPMVNEFVKQHSENISLLSPESEIYKRKKEVLEVLSDVLAKYHTHGAKGA